jgi:hypothetical protein
MTQTRLHLCFSFLIILSSRNLEVLAKLEPARVEVNP